MLNENDLQNRLNLCPDGGDNPPEEGVSVSVTRTMLLMAILAVLAGCNAQKFSNYSRVERDGSSAADVVKSGENGGENGGSVGLSLGKLFVKKEGGDSGGIGPDPVKLQKAYEICERISKEIGDEKLWHKTAELGSLKKRLVRYKGTGLEEIMTPQEYYSFVSSHVESPEDVRRVLIGLVGYKKDPDNILPSGVEVLSRGFGDCDQQSNLAKDLLRDLGRRVKKHDYSPRVISIDEAEHAVCIFVGEDGLLYSIDQEAEVVSFKNITDASDYYKKWEGKEFRVFELILDRGNIRIEMPLCAETLGPDFGRKMLMEFFDGKDLRDTDFANYLPSGWKKFDGLQVESRGNGFLHYKDGRLRSISFNDKTVEFYGKDGTMKERQLPDGTAEFYDNDGNVVERKFSDGTIEFYEDGVLAQRSLTDGTKELYGKDGSIKGKIFSDGSAEFYDKNNRTSEKRLADKTIEFYEGDELAQRNLPDGTEFGYDGGRLKYKRLKGIGYVEFYNESGVIVQKNYQSGRVELFDEKQGWRKQVNYPDGLVEVFDSEGRVVYSEMRPKAKEGIVAK